MTEAIRNIVAGYVSLKNRRALEEIRDHRRRLLHQSRINAGSWVSTEKLTSLLQEEISIVDAALDGFGGGATSTSR